MAFRLAPGVELVAARSGDALLAWSPLRLVTVNAPLARLLRAGGGGRAEAAPAAARALERLERLGLLRRDPPARRAGGTPPSVSVIVPVLDRAVELRRCLASLRRLDYPPDRLEVLVVDDGSRDDGPAVARELGARVVASGGRGRGPAAARNRGAAHARGELLAFVDSDCVASERWLAELVDAFDDPAVAAVGGLVRGLHTASALDRYEAAMSSLGLGGRARAARGGSDPFYLPSCNLLVRRAAFEDVGGFRAALHVGEDVDLSWRLRDRGAAIVYVPRGVVLHEHRNRLGPFLRRRFEYGTSEGRLDGLHPARRKRLVLPPALAAAALLAAAAVVGASPLAAGLAGAALGADGLRLWRRLRRHVGLLPLRRVLAARLRAFAGLLYHASFHLVRYHAPALVAAGVVWPRFGALAAAMALGAAATDHRVRRPALAFPAFLALYLAEHVAYGLGVFRGCLRERTFRSYRPVIVRDPS